MASSVHADMSFSQNLVLWLHVAFVAFTIGPVTLAVISTPRYIRQRDTRILRYLNRITFVFGLSTLGVLIAGAALASMTSVASKPWVIVAETLFLVALLLLALITRDQRKALKALEDAAGDSGGSSRNSTADIPAPAGTDLAEVDPTIAQDGVTGSQAGPNGGSGSPTAATAPAPTATALHLASVERGRIAMMGGLVALIWLVILVLMVWH